MLATDIGEVTDGDHLVITGTERPSSTCRRAVAHDGPVYERPVARPDWQDEVIASSSASLARPSTSDELRETLPLTMLASPALCSRKFITEQYDRYVRGNTVLAEHADSGVVRIDEETGLGIALATDASGRYTYLDHTAARSALAEAYHNVSVTGATPKAVTNCPTSVPRGPGGDVAVPAGRPRPDLTAAHS